MPNYKLAKERLNTGSQSGGLNTTLLNSRAGGDIRAPGVNVNAGNVRYSPMTPNAIIPDTTITAMANASNVMMRSAFSYSQREDKFLADNKLLELNESLREGFDGSMGADGNFSGGYGNTSLEKASGGYKDYHAGVEEKTKATLDSLTPQQQFYAFKGVAALKNSYLSKGASHAATQFSKAQEDQADRIFTNAITNINSGLNTYENIERAVEAYGGDPKEWKARNTQITNHALDNKFLTEGPEEAMKFAAGMAERGVGDPTAVRSFMNKVKSESYTDLTRITENNARIRAAAQRTAEDVWANNAADGAINGNIGEVFTALEGVLDPGKIESFVTPKIKSLIGEVVSSEADIAGDKGLGVARAREKLRAQWDQIPREYRDDVTDELDRLEQEVDADIIKKFKQDEELAAHGDFLTDRQELEKYKTAAEDFKNLPGSAEKTQATKTLIDLMENGRTESIRNRAQWSYEGSGNPEEKKILTRAYTDYYSDFVTGKTSPDGLNISDGEMFKLKKSIETDRKSRGDLYRKISANNLLPYFKLEKSGMGIGGYTVEDEGVNELAAKTNYAEALHLFNDLFTEFTAGKDRMSASEASIKALNQVITDPVIRSGMARKPEGEASGMSDKVSFADDMSEIRFQHNIPNYIPGLEGKANLTDFARTIGSTPQTEGIHPEIALFQRQLEVSDALIGMLENAKTTPEKSQVRRYMSNFMMQAMAMDDMISTSKSKFMTMGEVKSIDGDTAKQEGDKTSQRDPDINTPEMSTEEGVQAKDWFDSLLEALTGGSMLTQAEHVGLGAYRRHLASQQTADGSQAGKIQQRYNQQPAYQGNK